MLGPEVAPPYSSAGSASNLKINPETCGSDTSEIKRDSTGIYYNLKQFNAREVV